MTEEAENEWGASAVARAHPLRRDTKAALELLDVDAGRPWAGRRLAASGDLVTGLAGAAGRQRGCLHADLVPA